MSTRTDLIAALPWVTRLEDTQDCDALRWTHMPSKAIRWHGPGRSIPPEGTEKYRCRARARWQFTALPEGRDNPFAARSGTYCWTHLFTLGLLHGPAEELRFARTMTMLRKITEPGGVTPP